MQRGRAGNIHEQNIWVSLQGHGGASAELNSSAQSGSPSAPLHLVVTGVVVVGVLAAGTRWPNLHLFQEKLDIQILHESCWFLKGGNDLDIS